jgi:hypothetical protein
MSKNNYANKIIITMQEMMEQLDISDKTLHRMIDEGDLPEFTSVRNCQKRKAGTPPSWNVMPWRNTRSQEAFKTLVTSLRSLGRMWL